MIGFIGAGNMANAIINGMLSSGKYDPSNIYVFDTDESKKHIMKLKNVNVCKSSKEVVENSEYIVLAVKPQNYKEVLNEIKDYVSDRHVLISIAAGISIDFINSNLNQNCDIVRVMPNTPLLVGLGASAICGSEGIPKEKLDIAAGLFSTSGIVEFLTEDKMNAVISVNGSSPAYIYLFAKAMCDYAQSQGISYKTAMNLICKTMEGSAKMIMESGHTPSELIKMVSSPGGTTLAALDVLDQKDFYCSIVEAMKACTDRAEELAK